MLQLHQCLYILQVGKQNCADLMSNSMEYVLIAPYIKVLYVLSYHADNCYLIWSSNFMHFNLSSSDVSPAWFLMHNSSMKCHHLNINVLWQPFHILTLDICCRNNNEISRDQIANQHATSWLLMWLPHLDWIATESDGWFCPWHKHTIEVQGRLLLQSSGLLYV